MSNCEIVIGGADPGDNGVHLPDQSEPVSVAGGLFLIARELGAAIVSNGAGINAIDKLMRSTYK